MRRRSNSYWEQRAAEQLAAVEKESVKYLREIDKVYVDARRRNLEEVRKLYLNYYTKLGFGEAIRQLAPAGDMRRFMLAVEAAGLTSRLPAGYGFRLTRLELLEAQLWLEARKAALAHTALQTAAHKQTIDMAYYYSMYNLSKGTGVAPAFAQLNTRTMNHILSTKFHGKNYSQRVWNNSGRLSRDLRSILATATATGESHAKTARRIRDRYDVTRYEAARLVRTETNHFNSLSSAESYRSAGIEEFVYVATLDGRTSNICAELDGRRFDIDNTDMLPPQHPNCRSTTRALIGEEYEPDERIMRDVHGNNRIIENMTYKEWRTLFN